MNNNKIPVLMYHSVGSFNRKWIWNFLTTPFDIFLKHLQMISQKFRTINLCELYNYVANGDTLNTNSIVLTFDDGYLDNWVYVFPLLKKYNIKATIFVSPEFIDPSLKKRPNLENVWRGELRFDELISHGFMSWAELSEMENSGLVKIESHAMTHTWYFSGNRVVDFRHPGDEYVWMDWNKRPEEKYLYISPEWNPEKEYGTPVYEHKKSLETRIVYPGYKLKNILTEYVEKRGGTLFFSYSKWKKELFDIVKNYEKINKKNFMKEDEEVFTKRLIYEIAESKNIIESKLNKKVNFFCWPGGGICEEAIVIARKNYKAVTMPSSMKIGKNNCYGEDPFFIKRIGAPNINVANNTQYFNGTYLYHTLKEYQGNSMHRKMRQALKIYNMVRMKLKVKKDF